MMDAASTFDPSNIGISIHLLSFSFDKYLIKHDVRGIVMTYPETNKQEFVIKSKDIQFPNHLVTLNISKEAKMIFIFFQKKNCFSKDQFMAWTVIKMTNFPQDPQTYDYNTKGTVTSEIMALNVFEYYLMENEKENDRKLTLTERSFQQIQEVNGQIEVQLTMTEAFKLNEKHNHSKVSKNKSNDHFYKKKRVSIAQVCDLDQNEEEEKSKLIPLKEKKSDKKFHRKSKCSKDYINIE